MSSQINHHSPPVQVADQDERQRWEINNLQEWLSEPDRRAMLNIRGIERTCDLPAGTLKNWLRGSQGLAQHHLHNLVRMLSMLGYQAVTNEHRFV